MNYFIVVGSHRKQSQSTKVSEWVASLIRLHDKESHIDVLDLGKTQLPLWDEDVWRDQGVWPKVWTPISEKLKRAEAIVVISPEWSGMVPAGLKNFFLLCGNHEQANKPGLIIGVSAGMNGAYPVAELRMSSYKNNHICYIPDHVVVKNVEKVLNTTEPESKDDSFIRARLDYSVRMLIEYAIALHLVRESGVPDYKNFANGL